MDTTSGREHGQAPNDSIGFSVSDLINRVEEFQKRQQLETLERITMENSWLEFHIAQHRQDSTRTMNLLQEVHNAVVLMQEALEKCRLEEMKSNKAWLAFWGVREHPNTTPGPHPASWI